MNVNIEFFDDEPIENLITCLNYKMDKVIFFGQSDIMTNKKKEIIRQALRRLCQLEDVKFVEVSKNNLKKIVEVMDKTLQIEYRQGNSCFFDLTGGEDLVLVAMGILSTKYQMPMHQFDVWKNELHPLNGNECSRIEEAVIKNKVRLSIEDIVKLHGGSINYNEQKDYKNHLDSTEFATDVEKLWNIGQQNQKLWNAMGSLFQKCNAQHKETLNVNISQNDLRTVIQKSKKIRNIQEFIDYLKQLNEQEMIQELSYSNNRIEYHYKNSNIKDYLSDAGAILELHTYFTRKQTGEYSDCMIGVHLDWDGVILGPGMDVENEIDVLLMKGNIPVFISCKNGDVDQMALYEINTVADRFGGKYSIRELVASQEVARGYVKRAKEMGIEIRNDSRRIYYNAFL